MKSMKRVVVSFLVLSMVLIGVLMPNKAYASSNSDFVIENGVLKAYKGAGGAVVIPDGVTKIGDSAFSDCSTITSVKIPKSVTEIGDSAFQYCSKLTSVTIPNSVTEIGDLAFYGCSKLTSVTIPSSVTEIGYSAFSDTPWLDKKRTERADHLVIVNNILILRDISP